MNNKIKSTLVDGKEVYYGSWWIHEIEREIHFSWYYYQAKLVYENCDRSNKILEIGVGTNLLSDLLKRRKWNILTLDIDKDKAPDICESAYDYDFTNDNIDVILAFEIFEHIPFDTFEKIINNISKSNINKILFSLPWNERVLFNISLKFPKIRQLYFQLSLPLGHISTEAHFWELCKFSKKLIGKELKKVNSVVDLFHANGFSLALDKKIGNIQYFTATKNPTEKVS
jgi:uncharacterized UPF0146 family protein